MNTNDFTFFCVNQIKRYVSPISILIYIFSSIVLLVCANVITTESYIGYSSLEILLILFGFFFTTAIYTSINQELDGNFSLVLNKFKRNVFVFISVFSLLIIISMIYLIIYFIMSFTNILSEYDIVNYYSPVFWFQGKIDWFYFAYSIFFEILLIFFVAIFLNTLIKNKSIIYSISIIIVIYSLIFGNYFFIFIDVNDQTLNTIPQLTYSPKVETFRVRIWLNALLLPWNLIGITAKTIFFGANVNYFNQIANLNFGLLFVLLPYIYLLVFSLFFSFMCFIKK